MEGFLLSLVGLILLKLKVFCLATSLTELGVSGLVISNVRITSE